MADYDKVGLLVIRDNRILLCRKKYGTSLLILPGGCREPGETADGCLQRELREELGAVEMQNAAYIDTYSGPAAGGSGQTVQIELYRGDLSGEPAPHAEIAELVWFGPEDDRQRVSPSIAQSILPDLIRRGLLPWPPA